MDNVRNRINENAKNRNKKILLGIFTIIFVIMSAILLENNINNKPKDVTIMKNEISEEKASFIELKELDTNIIAVKATDGTYRLAFDDCIGCYYQYGKHARFKNNSDNTGLICQNCTSEIMYDEMGFLPEESMPYPIAESEITVLEDRFIIPAEYLEGKKQVITEMRKGKVKNNYSENPDN